MTPTIQRTELKTFYYTPVHCPFCGIRVMGADGLRQASEDAVSFSGTYSVTTVSSGVVAMILNVLMRLSP